MDIEIEHKAIEETIEDNLTLCCCRREKNHDETMKFVLKVDESHKGKRANLLQRPLFRSHQEGVLKQIGEEERNLQIPCEMDKNQLYGRQRKIHEMLKFLTNNHANSHRILEIYGQRGVSCAKLAQFAAKYAMDRHFLKDGAFYINAENRLSANNLLSNICKNIGLISSDRESLYYSIRKFRILLVIDECQNILKKNEMKFKSLILDIVKNTEFVKIIMINNEEEEMNMGDSDNELKKYMMQLKIEPLEQVDAVKMMHSMCAHIDSFYNKFPRAEDLNKYPMFSEFKFTPYQVSQMCILIQNGTSIDTIYSKQKLQREQENSQINKKEADELREKEMSTLIYEQIK